MYVLFIGKTVMYVLIIGKTLMYVLFIVYMYLYFNNFSLILFSTATKKVNVVTVDMTYSCLYYPRPLGSCEYLSQLQSYNISNTLEVLNLSLNLVHFDIGCSIS